MRVLHCIPTMGGGGAERQLAYLAEAWTRQGLDVHVALFDGGPNLDRLRSSRAAIHRLPCRSHYDPGTVVRLFRLIRSAQAHLVQTWFPQMDVFGGLAAAWAGVPFVVSERSSRGAYPGNWRDRLRGAVGKRAARVAANSEGGREYWISLGREAGSIAVIRNGIPFEEIDRCQDGLPEELRPLPDEELIVYAGRLIPEKNLGKLLDAIGTVLEAKPRARAIFFGEGPLRADLVAAAQRTPWGGRVRIHGYTDRIWSVLKRANVFVSVSTFEGNPNTVLEAAACRCPLLLSDIPAHREILDGDSAHFVSPASVPQIAAGIARALENSGESRRKAEKAYARVSRYSVESAAQAYLSLYRDVLDAARAQRGGRK